MDNPFRLTAAQTWLYTAGILAAAQLGKMPVIMTAASGALQVNLVTSGIIISLIELAGAIFGSVAAFRSARIGHRKTVLISMTALSIGNLGEACAYDAATMLVARTVESIGYLGIIVSAPVLMVREAKQMSAGRALVIWSTFLPIGLAIGAMAAGFASDAAGWRWTLAISGAFCLFHAALGLRLALPDGALIDVANGTPRLSRRILLAAGSFGCFTCFQVGMLSMIPRFFVSSAGLTLGSAGFITGAGALCTITGILVPLVMERRHALPDILLVGLFGISLIVPGALFLGLFRTGVDPDLAVSAFIALNVVSGVFPSLVFFILPRLVDNGDITAANGAIAQAGAAGSLVGPPLYASAISFAGWSAAAGFGLLVSLAAFGLIAFAEFSARQRKGAHRSQSN